MFSYNEVVRDFVARGATTDQRRWLDFAPLQARYCSRFNLLSLILRLIMFGQIEVELERPRIAVFRAAMKCPLLALIVVLTALPPFRCLAVEIAKSAPYGSWASPITAQMLVEKSVRIGDICLDGDTLYWIESRPEEDGRYVIVQQTGDAKQTDVLPSPLSARTLVHEYGGGGFLVAAGHVYFSNYGDQQIWQIAPGSAPQTLTREPSLRFADYVLDESRNRLICVCEDHRQQGQEAANRIVAVSLSDGSITTLASGADFYSTPRLSPDGSQLAWLQWNHPNMPWDGTELFVATIEEGGGLANSRKVIGGEDESIFQPTWSPEGVLFFVSDRTDWWNVYCERDGKVEAVLPMQAEFAMPQWIFGVTTYGFETSGDLLASYTTGGRWHLIRIDPDSGKSEDLSLPYTNISGIQVGRREAFITASSPTRADELAKLDLASGQWQTIRRSSPIAVDPDYTSLPEAIEFPTDNGVTSHAFYYPPTNRDYRGPEGEAPPLLVHIHGGPTSAARPRFQLTTQYWTSRGFAVCDVNYGGSTGYGRKYRNRLRQSWGIVDVADAANAANFLVKVGKADVDKVAIRGGSAGGYTTLACLTFRSEFRCGASYFGVSDLALLARETHKFESRYLDRLVGRYPQDRDRYDERSPITHLDRFQRPVILLQGLEDKIVPPNQAELIFAELKQKGIPVAYVPFEGEQHGFRKAENIIRAHEAELYFYSKVLGFPLSDPIEPIEIVNLPAP